MGNSIESVYVIPVVTGLVAGIVYLFKYIRDLYKEGREDKITMTTAVTNMTNAFNRNSDALEELKGVIIKRR